MSAKQAASSYYRKAHQLVVVGGGAGGLNLISRLGRIYGGNLRCEPILIDHTLSNIWKPLFHEVACGVINRGEDEPQYFSHSFENHYRFMNGKMMGLDRVKKQVILAPVIDENGNTVIRQRSARYDTLVLAVGSRSDGLRVPGVKENCFTLDNLEEAEDLKLHMFQQAMAVYTRTSSCPTLRIGVVGAGPVGVELCTEIHHTFVDLHNLGSMFKKDALSIALLETGPRILPDSSDALSDYTTSELSARGIDIRCSMPIKEVLPEGFVFPDGSLYPCDIKVWTPGHIAPNFLSTLGLRSQKNTNRLYVDSNLETSDHNVYAIGDCAVVPKSPTDKTRCPPSAYAAQKQVAWLMKRLKYRVVPNQKEPSPFVYKDPILTVSPTTGRIVSKLNGLFTGETINVNGALADAAYTMLHRAYQASIHGKLRTLMMVAAEKLRRVENPQIKVH